VPKTGSRHHKEAIKLRTMILVSLLLSVGPRCFRRLTSYPVKISMVCPDILSLTRLTNASVSMDQLDSLVIPFHLYFLPGVDLPSECPPLVQPGVCSLAEIKTAEQ